MIHRLRQWWKWRNHPEKAIWDQWDKVGGRCPYCIGTTDEDWLAICDCWEAERVLNDAT